MIHYEQTPSAETGYVQMEEQLLVKEATGLPTVAEGQQGALQQKKDGKYQVVSGKDFTAKFDTETGSLSSLEYAGLTIIPEGHGPRLDAFRAWANNDNRAYQAWSENGLHDLPHKALESHFVTNADGSGSGTFVVYRQGYDTHLS